MAGINLFKLNKADASLDDRGLTVRLWYPRNPEAIYSRIPENLEYGIAALERLKKEGHSEIADHDHPLRSPSAGSLYVTRDGKIICHRRDEGAPSHKLYHSAYAGFTGAHDEVYTAEGLKKAGMRETAEECLLVTKDKVPWLIVPKDSKEYTAESAKRIGLDMKPHFVDIELLDPTDRIEVFDEDGSKLFTYDCFSFFKWESETSVESVQIRRLPLMAEEILPIDTEGMVNKQGNYERFNRESYIISPEEIRGKRFGDVLENPQVFQAEIVKGMPNIYKPNYTHPPYYGPDMVPVNHPHVWAPEDQLTRHLDALGLGQSWIDVELWKERTKLEGKGLLPESVLEK